MSSDEVIYHVFVRMSDPCRKPSCFIIGKTTNPKETDKEYKTYSWESGWCYMTRNKYDLHEAENIESRLKRICREHGATLSGDKYFGMDKDWYVFETFESYAATMQEFDNLWSNF